MASSKATGSARAKATKGARGGSQRQGGGGGGYSMRYLVGACVVGPILGAAVFFLMHPGDGEQTATATEHKVPLPSPVSHSPTQPECTDMH